MNIGQVRPWAVRFLQCAASCAMLAACDSGILATHSSRRGDALPLPDYTVSLVSSSVAEGVLDDRSSVEYNVMVQNLGQNDTLGTYVAFYVDDHFVADTVVDGMETFAADTFSFVWNAVAGTHSLSFRVDQSIDPQFQIEEASESNNTASLAVTVPLRERHVVYADSMSYSSLPREISSDSTVQEVLAIAADSGYAVSNGGLTYTTQYDNGGVITYVTPLGSAAPSATAVPLLVVVKAPLSEDSTSVHAFVVHYIDQMNAVVYDAEGTVRIFAGDSTQVLRQPLPDPTMPALRLGGSPGCSEPWKSACLGKFGLATLACAATVAGTLFVSETPAAIWAAARALATCGGAAALAQGCVEALRDNPPVLSIVGVRNGAQPCFKCEGTSRITYTFDGYVATATDDRGPNPPIFLTNSEFAPSCNGGSFTFAVKDCGGHVTKRTVYARGRRLRVERNHKDCRDDAGAGYSLVVSYRTTGLWWEPPTPCASV